MYTLHYLYVLLFQILIRKATRPDLFIQVCGFVNVAREHRDALEVQPEALGKKVLDTHDVAGKVVLSVRMPSGSHLREIYDSYFFIVIY
jgi:hypothetical protein